MSATPGLERKVRQPDNDVQSMSGGRGPAARGDTDAAAWALTRRQLPAPSADVIR